MRCTVVLTMQWRAVWVGFDYYYRQYQAFTTMYQVPGTTWCMFTSSTGTSTATLPGTVPWFPLNNNSCCPNFAVIEASFPIQFYQVVRTWYLVPGSSYY